MKRGLRLGLDDALARDGEGPKTCLYEERIETALTPRPLVAGVVAEDLPL